MFKRTIIIALALGTVVVNGAVLFAINQRPIVAHVIDSTIFLQSLNTNLSDTPTTIPTVAVNSSGIATYIVQPGENLFRISLKFGLSVAALAQSNGIVNPNVVYPGQKLIIPGISPTNPLLNPMAGTITPVATNTVGLSQTMVTSTMTMTPIPHLTYTVQPGDNLFRIALKFNIPYAILAQLNDLTNLNLVYVGQTLKLPPGVTLPTVTNTPEVTLIATATISQIMAASDSHVNNNNVPSSNVASIAELSTPMATSTLSPTAMPTVPPADIPISAAIELPAPITVIVPFMSTVNNHFGFATGVSLMPGVNQSC